MDHLVNTASLGHTFYFEEVTDTSIFPHLMVWHDDPINRSWGLERRLSNVHKIFALPSN